MELLRLLCLGNAEDRLDEQRPCAGCEGSVKESAVLHWRSREKRCGGKEKRCGGKGLYDHAAAKFGIVVERGLKRWAVGRQRRSKEWFALEMSITVSLSNGKVMKQTD